MTEVLSIKYLATIIANNANLLGSKSKVKFILNPRVEKEKHDMRMENKNFLKILNTKPKLFNNESKLIIKKLINNKSRIARFKKSLI